MTGLLWGAVLAAVTLPILAWSAFCAGKKAERARRLRKEINAYEKMEKIRTRVDVLPVGVLLRILRTWQSGKRSGVMRRPFPYGRPRS